MAEPVVSGNTAQLGLQKILSTDIADIGKSFIEDMFAAYHDRETNTFHPAPFDPTTPVKLTKAQYKWVKGDIITDLGTLVFNRYLLEKYNLIQYTGYWNKVIDEDGLRDLVVVINNLCLEDKITTKMLGDFIDARDRLGFWCASFAGCSITAGLIRPMENVQKRKRELFKEYAEALTSDNPVTQVKASGAIESELLKMAKENLREDPGWDMYASGVNNFTNNFKTINVMRGAVFNNITKKYDVVESSLMEGVKKQDIPAFANSVVAGAYPSAVGTADAGYMSKKLIALLQSAKIDPDPHSNCGTTKTIPVTITKKYKQYFLYRYVLKNGKPTLTTLDNIDSFVGQQVQLYSPQCCLNDNICAKCAGQLFHKLGVVDIGMLTTQITQKLLNIKLKSKHDLSQNAGDIPNKYIFLSPEAEKYFTVKDSNLYNKVTMKMFIPRLLEELSGFYREATCVETMGLFPVKFYDQKGTELLSTMMSIPAVIFFNVYSDIQEDPDNYIITYEPDALICNLGIQKSVSNVEYFINQIYLDSKSPQMPYNIMLEMMFRCMEINGIDLTGPSITYELLARRVCRSGNTTFAKTYGKGQVDELSYTKLPFRQAVQDDGVLQGVLFQSISESMNKGLAATLNGRKPVDTPLERIIKA
jgi:hypothetical protein